MGYLGKSLLGATIGVVAIAAAPFTGGGSLLGGATLAASLTGAGVAAGVAGVVGAAGGAMVQGAEDLKKAQQIKKAKEYAFMDGINKGKEMTVDQIQKFADFCLASTALSYWIARCDGDIDEKEMLELQFDLDSIKKNKDLPDAIKNELAVISMNEKISFSDVKNYLDKLTIDTLKELESDIEEIIQANGEISKEEEKAKNKYKNYLQNREKKAK